MRRPLSPPAAAASQVSDAAVVTDTHGMQRLEESLGPVASEMPSVGLSGDGQPMNLQQLEAMARAHGPDAERLLGRILHSREQAGGGCTSPARWEAAAPAPPESSAASAI